MDQIGRILTGFQNEADIMRRSGINWIFKERSNEEFKESKEFKERNQWVPIGPALSVPDIEYFEDSTPPIRDPILMAHGT